MKKGLVMSTIVVAAAGLLVLFVMSTFFLQQYSMFYETKSIQDTIQDKALCIQLTQQGIKAGQGLVDTDEDGLADFCDVCPNNFHKSIEPKEKSKDSKDKSKTPKVIEIGKDVTDTDSDGLSEVGIKRIDPQTGKEDNEPYLDKGYMVNKCDSEINPGRPPVCEFGEDRQRGKCRCRYGFIEERCATKEEWDALKSELNQRVYRELLDQLLQKISNGLNTWNFQEPINFWEQEKRKLSTTNLEELKSMDKVMEILKFSQVSQPNADNLASISASNKQKLESSLAQELPLPYKQEEFTAFAKGIGHSKLGVHLASQKNIRESRQQFLTAFQEMAKPASSSTALQSQIMIFAEFIPGWLEVKEVAIGEIGEIDAIFQNNNAVQITSGSSRGYYEETQRRFDPVFTRFNPQRPSENDLGELHVNVKDQQGIILLGFNSPIDVAMAKGFDRVFEKYCRPKEEAKFVDCIVKEVFLPGADMEAEFLYPDFGEIIKTSSASIAGDVVENEFGRAVRTLERAHGDMPAKFKYKEEIAQALILLEKITLTPENIAKLQQLSGEQLRLRMAGAGSEDHLIFWVRAKLALLQTTGYDQQRQAFNQIYSEYDKIVDEYTNQGAIQPTQELVTMGRNLNVLVRDSFYQSLSTAQVDVEASYKVHVTVGDSRFSLVERGDPHGEPYRTLGIFREPAQGTQEEKAQQRTRLDFAQEYDLTIGRQLIRKLREDCSFLPSGETERVLYEGCKKFKLHIRIPAHEGYPAYSEPADLYSKK